jgi:hypothetical protein
VNRLIQRALVLATAALLTACGANDDDAPRTAPTGFAVSAGDTSVVVTWDMEPGLTYWIFSAAAPAITRDNFSQFAAARITQPATSPQLISGLANGTTYSFVINATRGGSAGGPATASIAAVPRLAGGVWTAGAPLAADLNAIGFGAGRYLAVGAGGALFTRGGGVLDTVWTAGSTGTSANLNGLVTAALIVAVGDAGTIVTSSDAVAWTARASGTGARLNAVAFAVSAYVAVGDGGTIVRSTDGIAWSTVSSGTTNALHGVALLGGTLVAVGANGTVLSSSDGGSTWTAAASGTSATLRAAAVGAGRFVIVGDGGTILTSTDLAAWSAAASPTARDLLRVVFGSQFVAVGAGGTALTSGDGLAWSAVSTGTGADLRGLARGVALDYLAVGAGGVNLVAR